MLCWHLGGSWGPSSPNSEFPHSCQVCSTLGERLPKGSSLAVRPAAPHLVLNPVSFASLPACGIIKHARAHLPLGNRGHPTGPLLQSQPPTAPAASLCSQVQPLVALHGVRSLPAPDSIPSVPTTAYIQLSPETYARLSHPRGEEMSKTA